MKNKINWDVVYLHWLSENLRIDRVSPYLYKDLAKKFNIAEKTVRTHAAKGKWQNKLNEKLLEQKQEIVSKVQAQQIVSEAEIRLRQAEISQKMIDKAMVKFESISSEDLSVKQAIELIKIGMVEQRKALGLPDKYEVTNLNKNSEEYVSVEARIKRFEKTDELAAKLLDYICDNAIQSHNE